MSNESTITDWTKLGGLLRDARRTQGLTQAELAARAGVARSWLARVEAGHRGAELEPMLRLLAALDLSLTLRPTDQARRQRDEPAYEAMPSGTGDGLRAAAQARRAAWGLPVDGHQATTDE